MSSIVPALEISGVSHRFGPRVVLDQVSFEVPRGSFTVLLGPNGAGKSTLFALVTRLYAARQGAIAVFGQNIARAPGEALEKLGVVFQARTLDLDLTVTQNLAYHAALHGLSFIDARSAADRLLDRFGMSDRKDDWVRTLSGGQMRRLEIARALLHNPLLLLLDEPTVGLDTRSRAEFISHVRRLVRDNGLSVLWATHLIDEVASDDRVVILDRGKLRAAGTVSEVAGAAGARDLASAFQMLTSYDASLAPS
jgi:ABC-2 type transport system ATP-binding protein